MHNSLYLYCGVEVNGTHWESCFGFYFKCSCDNWPTKGTFRCPDCGQDWTDKAYFKLNLKRTNLSVVRVPYRDFMEKGGLELLRKYTGVANPLNVELAHMEMALFEFVYIERNE